MSIFHRVDPACPSCGATIEAAWSASVNADRRPDLSAAIADGSFQRIACPSCGAAFRLPPHLTYLHLDRDLWIAARPFDETGRWREAEAEAREIFAASFGDRAPPAIQEMAAMLRPRLVFGWPALREKLLCTALDLDDTTLELLKLSIMREVDGAPMADDMELRLSAGDTHTLRFTWIDGRYEEAWSGLKVPRDMIDEIDADPETWDPSRARFDDALLVDLRRFLTGG